MMLILLCIPVILWTFSLSRTIDSLMKKDNVICNEKDLQLGTEYFFPEIGVRLWRERAFHPKLLKDPLYMEEMQAVLEDEYQYQYFQMVTIIG